MLMRVIYWAYFFAWLGPSSSQHSNRGGCQWFAVHISNRRDFAALFSGVPKVKKGEGKPLEQTLSSPNQNFWSAMATLMGIREAISSLPHPNKTKIK